MDAPRSTNDPRTDGRAPDGGLAELLEDVLAPLAPWMVRQRWYPAKGSGAPRLHVRGAARIPSPGAAEGTQVLDLVVRAEADGTATDYQVPIVMTPEPVPDPGGPDPDGQDPDGEDPDALIAVLDRPATGAAPAAPADDSSGARGPSPSPRRLRIEDACRTDVGRRALLGVLAAGDRAGDPLDGPGLSLDPAPVPGRALGRVVATRLLSGEQSNSSMIFTLEDAEPVILKLFRVLAEGENPDVVLQGALDRAGCTRIAPMVGSARVRVGGSGSGSTTADEPHRRGADAPLHADALLAQRFLPDVEDAWRVALQQAAGGLDFREGARDLGAAVAEVHRLLATALPSAPTEPPDRTRVLDQMRSRLKEVAAQVPQVLPHAPALRALIDAAADADWPPLQRIHGDLHLGQVLADPARGWVLLDFEGEPLRPLAERTLPDCPVRDVAGMLRSLDYAGGAVLHEDGVDASDWVAESSRAFLEGYLDAMGIAHDDPSFRALLRAFEADKAVYEVLYETRNRPDWLPIPLGALARLSSR